MQMTGQERIAAPEEQVWAALQDPEILKRCLPGCQSLTREADGRMRATLEVKIGPIGARFNGTVALSDIEPRRGYTMTLEGQGGTVGFVKGGTKVRLADDGTGGTQLSYHVDAQVGGRLAQLGGPLIDATAKQFASRFFQQFGSLVGKPGAAAAVPEPATVQAAAPTAAGPAVPATSRGAPVAWMLALVVAGLVGYLIGHGHNGGAPDWMGLAIGLLLMIVAAAGFEFGRRTAAPVVVLDASLLARLTQEPKR